MRASEKNLRLFFPGCARAVDVRAAMIDLDGTMVNTLGDFDLALNGMLAEQQWPRVECSFIERMIGKGSPHLVRQTLLHLGLGRDGAVDDALYDIARIQQFYQFQCTQNGGHAGFGVKPFFKAAAGLGTHTKFFCSGANASAPPPCSASISEQARRRAPATCWNTSTARCQRSMPIFVVQTDTRSLTA